MNLSNVSNMRFNGADVKLAKIDGVVVYKKYEENTLLKVRYTANTSGVLPKFNDGYVYEVNETENNGIYTVEITSEDDFSSCSFYGITQLLAVSYLECTSKVTSMMNMFNGCNNLTSLNLSGFDTSNATNMISMFNGCNNLTSLNLSGFDTSNVASMMSMFNGCNNLTSLNLSGFDTSKVTSMMSMFNGCNNLTSLNLSGFDTSKVTSMINMFAGCSNLTTLDISGFDTSNVTSMAYMFAGCNNLTSLNSMINISVDLTLPEALNQESISDVVNNLSAVSSTKTLKISATQLTWISEDEIKEVNNKGWTISA